MHGQILIFYEQPIYNELCFMLDCEGGGTRTDISGQLNFLRGSGPHERECEWTIENPDNSSNVIVTGFHNSEDCGYGFIDSHMLLHSQSFHIWWSSLFAYRAALGSVFQAFSGLVPSKEKRKVALCLSVVHSSPSFSCARQFSCCVPKN